MKFGYSFSPAADCRYDPEQGYGFAISAEGSKNEDLKDSWPGDYFTEKVPTLLMDVPNGNYKVTLQLGSPDFSAVTTVREGLGRIMVLEAETAAGEHITRTFAVHVDNGQLKLAFGEKLRQYSMLVSSGTQPFPPYILPVIPQ